jgi:hypothetical protein
VYFLKSCVVSLIRCLKSEDGKTGKEGKRHLNEEKATNNVETEPKSDLNDDGSLFSLKRPKDIRDGLGHGAGNILKGALGGAALFVTAAIKGAYDGAHEVGTLGGIKGFGLGLGMGVVGGLGMALGGAFTGAYQIGRGLYNTPGSISDLLLRREKIGTKKRESGFPLSYFTTLWSCWSSLFIRTDRIY